MYFQGVNAFMPLIHAIILKQPFHLDANIARKMAFMRYFLRGTFYFIALPAFSFTALQFTKAESPEIKSDAEKTPRIAIIGSGIGGSATAHFLREILGANAQISVFEKANRVGGRLATLDFAGDTFESGGSIIHPRNLYMKKFVDILGRNFTLLYFQFWYSPLFLNLTFDIDLEKYDLHVTFHIDLYKTL